MKILFCIIAALGFALSFSVLYVTGFFKLQALRAKVLMLKYF